MSQILVCVCVCVCVWVLGVVDCLRAGVGFNEVSGLHCGLAGCDSQLRCEQMRVELMTL